MKIVRSRDLGITATPKHNESVEIVETLVMLQIVWKGPRARNTVFYWPYLSTAPTAGLLMHTTYTPSRIYWVQTQ